MSKCPYCERIISQVDVEDVSLNVGLQPRWRGFSYSCPACHKVLGIQLNPLTLCTEIAEEVAKRLGRAD